MFNLFSSEELSYEIEKPRHDSTHFTRSKEKRLYRAWLDFVSRTTFHGLKQITVTEKGTRLYYSIVFALVSAFYINHLFRLIVHYYKEPTSVEIKYGYRQFRFPDVTLCPNSATDPETFKQLTNISLDHNRWNVSSEYVPRLRKKLLTKYFYSKSKTIGLKPLSHVIYCNLNGIECLDQIDITEHPLYYRCFTLSLKSIYTRNRRVQGGPSHGIKLIIFKGNSVSALQSYKETDPFTPGDTEGYQVAIHTPETYPNDELYNWKEGNLVLPFGTQAKIGVTDEYYEGVSVKRRRCWEMKKETTIVYQKHDFQSKAPLVSHNTIAYSYSQEGCFGFLRQMIYLQQCNCYFENHLTPHPHYYKYMHLKTNLTWCHSPDLNTRDIESRSKCMARVNAMNQTDIRNYFLDREIEYTQLMTELGGGNFVPIGSLRSTMMACPSICNRHVYSIKHKIVTPNTVIIDKVRDRLKHYFEMMEIAGQTPAVGINDTLSAKQVIILNIYATSELINSITESLDVSTVQLWSSIGAISGLYIGLTIYTISEIMDFIYIIINVVICKRSRKKLDNNKQFSVLITKRGQSIYVDTGTPIPAAKLCEKIGSLRVVD